MQTRRDFLKVSVGGLLLAGGVRGACPAAAADRLGPAHCLRARCNRRNSRRCRASYR